jgi:hypothetical protein
VKKTRQNKKLEPGFDSIKAGNVPAPGSDASRICAAKKSARVAH